MSTGPESPTPPSDCELKPSSSSSSCPIITDTSPSESEVAVCGRPTSAPSPARRRHQLSAGLLRAWRNGLAVTRQELDDYIPTETDAAIASALLAGALTFEDIAGRIGWDARRVAEYMESPVATAWIGREVSTHIETRMFLVTASLFQQAIGQGRNSVAAAKLLLERFGQLVRKSEVVVHQGMDLQKLSDEEIQAQLETIRKEGQNASAE